MKGARELVGFGSEGGSDAKERQSFPSLYLWAMGDDAEMVYIPEEKKHAQSYDGGLFSP